MTNEEKIEFMEKIIREQQENNIRLKLNIKYFKLLTLPELAIDHKKKKIGKAELDIAKAKAPTWERTIKMNIKFMDLIRKEIKYLKKS